MDTFVDRKRELQVLKNLHSENKPKLVLVFGRRRVGKTALLQEFSKHCKGLYFLARQESGHDQLKSLSHAMANHFHDTALFQSPLQNYDAAFSYLEQHLEAGTPVFLDEFPYMVESTPALPSILQDHWDNHFQKKPSFFVLCGSSIRMMERLAGYKSPIYGRRTEQIRLGPLGFFDALELVPGIAIEKAVFLYSILGGTPAYWSLVEPKKSVEQNAVEHILPKTAFLNQDALFILREELDEPRNYFSILKSIAKGHTRLGNLTNDTGLERPLVAKYLSVLRDLKIVQRRVPLTENRPENSRRGIYAIEDPYFRFWFGFVFENQARVEAMGAEKTWTEKIAPQFNAYVGRVFEDIALDFLQHQTPWGKNHWFGRHWKDAQEIDVVALGENRPSLLLEVKWSDLNDKKAREELEKLEDKKQSLDENFQNAALGLVAKKIENKTELKKNGYIAYDLNDFPKP